MGDVEYQGSSKEFVKFEWNWSEVREVTLVGQ